MWGKIIQPVLIIGLSGNTQAQDIAAGLASGMNIYLTKPCNRETLLKAIANKPLSNTETTSNSSPEMIWHDNLSTADGFSIQQHDRRDTHP